MSRDVYCHAILLPCAKFNWNWTIGCWVMAKNGGSQSYWILKICVFGHVTVTVCQICIVYQISSKSDHFSLRYGDFTIFKMADLRHLEF